MKSKNIMKIVAFMCIPIVVITLIITVFFVCFPKSKRSLINEMASKYNLSAYLVASVINIESRYKDDALSTSGAMGLMQLLPSTAIECANKIGIKITIDDLYIDAVNIELGCYYLAYLMDLFDNNVTNVLAAYNWGLNNVRLWTDKGNVDEHGSIINIPIKETKNYLKKYKVNKFVYQKIYGY